MGKSSMDIFVCVKASGMLAKSFVGPRASELFSAASLEGLWELLFRSEPPSVPDFALVQMIERKAEERFLRDFGSLVGKYSKPHDFFVDLLRFYDYNNLKAIIASLDSPEGQKAGGLPPNLSPVGRRSMLNYGGWPSLESITERSPVSWCSEVKDSMTQQDVEARLDGQYVRGLWDSASDLDRASREPVRALLREEIVLNNIVWGLRLRTYYGMTREEVLSRLATAKKCGSTESICNDTFVRPMVQALSLPLDSRGDWDGWKYSYLLNPRGEEKAWAVDPQWIQRMARLELYKRALRQFHRYPFTSHVLFCWFKVKQYELDCIRMAVEGIRLKMSPAQIGEFAGTEIA